VYNHHRYVNVIDLRIFCDHVCKTSRICHQQTRLSSPSKQSSNWHATQDKQACSHNTLWRQRYVTTTKEYLISIHITLKYFESVFLQLQLLEILCELIIIWVNYERNKNGSIFMKQQDRCYDNRVLTRMSAHVSFEQWRSVELLAAVVARQPGFLLPAQQWDRKWRQRCEFGSAFVQLVVG